MIHRIENDRLTCTIDSNGAEIRSLASKATNEEHIWQIDPAIWGSSSPVLFPAIGKIKGDEIILDGKAYAMSKHGIIRHNDSLLFEQDSSAQCRFRLVNSDETLLKYPYAFSFSVQYSLVENRLIMTYEIENRDDIPMYFTCGGHTAYACPLTENTSLSDYVIEFPTPLDLQSETLGESGLLSYRKREVHLHEGILPLTDSLFNSDALIFKDISYDWVRLRKRDEKKGIVVRFSGYPNLALWSKPAADFVCIEPWLGLPDREDESIEIPHKSSLTCIEPKTVFSITIETELEKC